MRILLAHNHYQSSSPSGEDMVFENERQLLERAGHEVICYTRYNDDISGSIADRVAATASLFWSTRSYREISAFIKKHQPEVAHFHNTFPLISASGYAACKHNLVPVVQTLHNYRLICPGALLLRNGKPCEDCIGNVMLSAVKHGCYRQSRAGTALVAGMLNINRMRGAYQDTVDRYICLTDNARARFIRGGLPADKLTVKANVLRDAPTIGTGDGGYALYVGRLTQEKGVATLINAWQGVDYPLKVAGDGAMREALQQQCQSAQSKVEFLGFRSRDEVMSLMQRATLLIIPSECYEGFPVTVLEAFATGTPLAVSAIGALDELVNDPTNGRKFSAGNAGSLRNTVLSLLRDPAALQAMRIANRRTFEQNYAATQALVALETIYHQVIAQSHTKSLLAVAQAQ